MKIFIKISAGIKCKDLKLTVSFRREEYFFVCPPNIISDWFCLLSIQFSWNDTDELRYNYDIPSPPLNSKLNIIVKELTSNILFAWFVFETQFCRFLKYKTRLIKKIIYFTEVDRIMLKLEERYSKTCRSNKINFNYRF